MILCTSAHAYPLHEKPGEYAQMVEKAMFLYVEIAGSLCNAPPSKSWTTHIRMHCGKTNMCYVVLDNEEARFAKTLTVSTGIHHILDYVTRLYAHSEKVVLELCAHQDCICMV